VAVIGTIAYERGQGRTKKEAEQIAARETLRALIAGSGRSGSGHKAPLEAEETVAGS